MASKSRPILDAARAAARNNDSAPTTPAPTAASEGDLPAQKAIDSQSAETGNSAAEGLNRTIQALDRVRVSSSGQVLTTNQGVAVADNQNSLSARGPALLAEAQIPLTLPDGSADPGLILADAVGAEDAIAGFIEAVGQPRDFSREANPPMATAGSGA